VQTLLGDFFLSMALMDKQNNVSLKRTAST